MNELLVFQVAPILAKVALEAIKRFSSASAREHETDEPLAISPVFGNYLTLNEGFAAGLGDLRDLIQSYVDRPSATRPLNVLLASEPGNGKSFLIKQLAGSCAFEEFHVAAFRSIDDLFSVFQRVQSANLKGRLPFVLFDEVDAMVDGRYILANFLAPMWDGAYFLGNESLALGRAVFFFAASKMVEPPTVENVLTEDELKRTNAVSYAEFAKRWKEMVRKKIEEDSQIEKCLDFLDRIDQLVCIPPVHETLTGERATLERVQLACLLIRKHFKTITRVERAAAVALAKKIATTTSRRPAETSVFCSRVSAGANIFEFDVLPRADRERYGSDEEVSSLRGKYYQIEP